MTQMTWEAIAGVVYATGLRGEPAAIAVALTQPESSRDPTKLNDNARTGDFSWGLWQINMRGSLGPARRKQFGIPSDDYLIDPAINAKAMYAISSGGTNFAGPWATSYGGGKYRPYLSSARAAVSAVEARNGVTGGASSSALEATAPPAQIVGEFKPPGGGLAPAVYVDRIFPTLHLPGGNGDLTSRLGIDGQVNLSVNSVSEITLTIASPRTSSVWGDLLVGNTVNVYGLDLVVTDHAWGDQDGVEVLTVTLQPAGVQKLRTPRGGRTWNSSSPSQVLEEIVVGAGLRFYSKATAQRAQIVQLDADASAGRDFAESDWELGERLAKEEGFWWFEAAGAVYFAPPTWLRDSTTRFPIRNQSTNTPGWNAIGPVQASVTLNAIKNLGQAQVREITAALPRWRGEQVRPGMVAVYAGTPGWSGTDLLIVTDVSWPLDGGVAPATVTATTPVDPTPEPAQDDTALIGADNTVTPSAGSSTGTPVSGGGAGTYGYQYDKVGTTPSGGPQPGTVALRDAILHRFPKAHDSGLYVPRKVNGSSTMSVHAEGRAWDAGVPVSSQLGYDIANFLVANAPLYGIQLLIWDAHIWTTPRRTEGWRPFQAANGKTDVTSLHRDHVHIEQCWEAAKHFTAMQAVGAVGG